MIVMIDNYDSFTYNLVQLLWGRGVEVEVLRNDAASVDEVLERRPRGIILSPGPGRPEGAGICVDLVRSQPQIPLLGVCLGHQVLGTAFGAEIGRAPRLMHGKTSLIRHLDRGVFKSLSNPFEATRYHSLEVRQESLPEELEPIAWSDEETLMGMRHRQLPYQGVQFHPESILTIEGPQLIDNFLAECDG
jgi:anthranilate synthase/aminodeoxychorismate synthase-like glutamine amidotransferase